MKTPVNYKVYIVSKEWVEIADRIKKRDGMRCGVCYSIRCLSVHHGTYKNLGHERDSELFTLCRFCHDKLHKSFKGNDLASHTRNFIKSGQEENDQKKKKEPERLSAFKDILVEMAKRFPKNKKLEQAPAPVFKSKNVLRMEESRAKKRAKRERRKASGSIPPSLDDKNVLELYDLLVKSQYSQQKPAPQGG